MIEYCMWLLLIKTMSYTLMKYKCYISCKNRGFQFLKYLPINFNGMHPACKTVWIRNTPKMPMAHSVIENHQPMNDSATGFLASMIL